MASSITVALVTVPSDSHKFTFVTELFTGSSALDPVTFSLADGETQVFSGVTVGVRVYRIHQIPDLNYAITSVVPSNGSVVGEGYYIDVTVGADEDVVLTYTNTYITPPVAVRTDWELYRFSMRTRIEERS